MQSQTQTALEWSGTAPDDWRTLRIKALFHDDTTSISVDEFADQNVEHYSIPAFDESGAPSLEDGATIASNKTLLRGGELLFSRLNSHKPRVWLVQDSAKTKVASTEFIALRAWHPTVVHKPYFCYLLGSNVLAKYISCFQTSVTNSHKRISPDDLWRLRVPVPPFVEQESIAALLDRTCSSIDAAVEAKRQQLEVLRATIAAIVFSAVTGGLDPTTARRRSGLDWLPEVPAHWRTQQIKRVCNLVRGQFTHRPRNDPALYDGEYPFVQTGDITAADKYIRTYSQTLNELGRSVSKTFPRGTLVMSIAANIGDVAILDFEACFPDSMIGMIPGHTVELDYLYYLMRAMKPIMLRSAVLSTQLNLNYVRIGTNFAAFPPKKEQAAIAEFLDRKEREVANVRDTLIRQIETLVSYRKSLIHEYVTGQRRVREAAPNPIPAYA